MFHVLPVGENSVDAIGDIAIRNYGLNGEMVKRGCPCAGFNDWSTPINVGGF